MVGAAAVLAAAAALAAAALAALLAVRPARRSAAQRGTAGTAGEAMAGSPPRRVAFIGNSFTYYNDLPAVVARLAGPGMPLTLGSCLHGGVGLAEVVARGQGEKAPRFAHTYKTVEQLLAEPWDVVVLQDHSQSLDERRAAKTRACLPALSALLAACPGRPRVLLFSTWAYKDNGAAERWSLEEMSAGLAAP